MNVPENLMYTDSHEWVNPEEPATIGISDFAQQQLGDITYVELPDLGASIAQGDEVAVVESVKAASDIYAPVSGKVVEVNEGLEDSPELVNSDPYGEGWLFKLEMSEKSELDSLMNAETYRASQDS